MFRGALSRDPPAKKKLALTLVLGVLAPSVLAHDMWVVPPKSAVAGQPLEVALAVGMDFPRSTSAIALERLEMSWRGPRGAETALELRTAPEDRLSYARLDPGTSGAWLVGCTTKPRVLEMKADEFNEYLLHDGLGHVLGGRMERGETGRDAAERYSKSVKALVDVEGGSEGPAPDRSEATAALGHRLEIVPMQDPATLEPGDTLRARVLFWGAPLKRANLCWDLPGNGEDFSGQTWTDAEGVALVPLRQRGLMTLRLVHLTRPRTADFEWESFWASFTFRLR